MNRHYLSFLPAMVMTLFVLGGCALGPDYQRPELAMPAGFRTETTTVEESFGDLSWRAVYSDPAVQALIEEALGAAPDIHLAEARVREAEAVAGVVRADILPRLGLSFTSSPIPRPAGDTLASNYTLKVG